VKAQATGELCCVCVCVCVVWCVCVCVRACVCVVVCSGSSRAAVQGGGWWGVGVVVGVVLRVIRSGHVTEHVCKARPYPWRKWPRQSLQAWFVSDMAQSERSARACARVRARRPAQLEVGWSGNAAGFHML